MQALQQRSLQQPTRVARADGRLRRVVVKADHAARVRGDARRVQRWVSDMRHWTQFYPGEVLHE